MQSTGIIWPNRLIKFGFYLLFTLVPLLLTPLNYELFEYNKMMGVYVITTLIVTSWIVKCIAQKEVRLAKTVLDIPIILFSLSQLVSAVFSMDPHVSWFGYYSRFNGGMWSIISYVLLYYAFVSNSDAFTPVIANQQNKTLKVKLSDTLMFESYVPLLKASLVTATLVAAYAVLEHLGIDKHIWVQDVQNRVFSTLGQPNWLAAYLVALTPLAMAFGIHALSNGVKTLRSWITFGVYATVSALFFITLLYTRSRSGLLGLAVADIIFWGLILLKHKVKTVKDFKELPLIKPLIICHVVFALIIFLNGTYIPQLDKYVTLQGWKATIAKTSIVQSSLPNKANTSTSAYTAPALESGGTESTVIRKYVWEAAIRAWASTTKTKLIGTGTETFAFAFYQFRPVEHNQTSEWDFLYNKAHNEYLNYLATTGAFGLGSYLLFIGVFIYWFIKKVYRLTFNVQSESPVSPAMNPLALNVALFAGWTSILVTNFFGFSVVILQLFLFLFPAIIYVSSRGVAKQRNFPLSLPRWSMWILLIVAIYVLIKVSSFWYADTKFASGYQYDRAGLYGQGAPLLLTAISLNPAEPMYHDELSGSYAALAAGAASAKNATQAAELAQLALTESDKALATSPRNVNFLKTRTKVLYTLSSLDPTLNTEAIKTLKVAAALSPNDPKIYYNLAILSGRGGKNDDAVTYLLKAKTLKPDYRDAYNALNIFYSEMKDNDKAKAILQEYLSSIDPNDKDFLQKLK